MAEEIRKHEKEKKIKIELFSDAEEYKEKIKSHILNLKKYSDINQQNNSDFLVKQFKDFIRSGLNFEKIKMERNN